MSNTIADFTFGVNNQAIAVLHMLDREPDFADYNDGFYQVTIRTRPWYNGRESGFVLSMHKDYKTTLHIAVFEHRNSDNICALEWTTEHPYCNHPLEDANIFDKAYGGRDKYGVDHSVSYGEAGKMANWVYGRMAQFYGPKNEKAE